MEDAAWMDENVRNVLLFRILYSDLTYCFHKENSHLFMNRKLVMKLVVRKI